MFNRFKGNIIIFSIIDIYNFCDNRLILYNICLYSQTTKQIK